MNPTKNGVSSGAPEEWVVSAITSQISCYAMKTQDRPPIQQTENKT
jgi:hypothetical protein